ncbi:anhydro-N-acetylmuramic acid kinase [Pacificimonas sp. WHA3]|uniref:Anhydro-N-acetylmuramic acid kinase n=1 Tax=Pacificimonas pallii TaxID=2827236 RepID=A0ABS6SF68_9SPHN|nr:anhydro-N-acetylmuramic acid kinase [Pacificimonas pallii]MBV7256905.1 anhydro-N-acetylmuramic acid kinase [Pacificimonas pallii]
MSSRLYRAIGLMSGTSMDGIDAALIETDGEAHIQPLAAISLDYDEAVRSEIRGAVEAALAADAPRRGAPFDALARRLTLLHTEAVKKLGEQADIIGFHGQTVAHRPDRGWTWQIGDGAVLAQLTRIDVVDDLRSADVAAGGEGAPLLPAYHRARAEALGRPLGVLNLGGVGNLTWLGDDGALIAFDTGPGNALIDDWVRVMSGVPYDDGGRIAGAGAVHQDVLANMLDLEWFDRPPPKSLDRLDFSTGATRGLSAADGAATLTAFTAETVALALAHVPQRPQRLLVTGGGRHNPLLMRMIAARAGIDVAPVESVGWNGDALEAEGFAWMAVRHLRGLPTSFPEISGPSEPVIGGTLHRA